VPSIRLTAAILLSAFALISAPVMAQPPLINEFMASNATTIADDDGDYSDWIELYNPGLADYELKDHYLSDDSDDPLR